MAVTDFSEELVRIRQGSNFISIPPSVEVGENLKDGQFVRLSTTLGQFLSVGKNDRATHLLTMSGINRVTAQEIVDATGKINQNEPAMTITGLGTATIPFIQDIIERQEITCNDGWAVPYDGSTNAFIVGIALDTVVGATLDNPVFADAFLQLPAQFTTPTAS